MTRAFARCVALATVAAAAAASAADPASAPTDVTIVLVHGALLDGSSWRGVYDSLTTDGYRVRIVQEPLTGLADDVAATQRVIAQVDGPVILVGHSYGGEVITEAGADPKVRALVYVAALQPDVGETGNQLAGRLPGTVPSADFRISADGFASLETNRFAGDVGADLPPAQARYLAQAQMPIAAKALNTAVSAAAWHDRPSYGIVATADCALNPALAQWMYRRSHSAVTAILASHLVLISHPVDVARVIERAARDTGEDAAARR